MILDLDPENLNNLRRREEFEIPNVQVLQNYSKLENVLSIPACVTLTELSQQTIEPCC